MGIYAPGITKPDHCCNCQFCEDSTDDCLLQNDAHWSTYSEQIKNCPLIEIPEPHGRLIDADALDTRVRQAGGMGNVEEECTEDFNDGVLFVLDYFVKNAPTVIPREDGENHEP